MKKQELEPRKSMTAAERSTLEKLINVKAKNAKADSPLTFL
jgi:hypothetical protein